MSDRIVLTLTKEQADVISSACNLFARVLIGQFDEVKRTVENESRLDLPQQARDLMRSYLDLAGGLYTKLPPNASFGIHGEQVPDSARIAFDLHQVIRNFGHDVSKCGWCVYDSVHQTSTKQLLPEIKHA